MADIDKIINKMKRQPHGIKLQEIEKVLKAYGYERVRQKGSHITYKNNFAGERVVLAIHGKNTLKRAYVENILEVIDEGEEQV